MKTMLFCLSVASLMGYAACSKAETTPLQSAYCHAYAEHEYSAGREFEGAAEECEVQFLAVGVQWDEPSLMANFVETAMRAQSTESVDAVLVNPLPMAEALRLAGELGRYGVDKAAGGWLPTTAAEDAAADAGAL